MSKKNVIKLSGSPVLEKSAGVVTTDSQSDGPSWVQELYDNRPLRLSRGSFGKW